MRALPWVFSVFCCFSLSGSADFAEIFGLNSNEHGAKNTRSWTTREYSGPITAKGKYPELLIKTLHVLPDGETLKTLSGHPFTRDARNPKLGVAWRDPSGLVWGSLVRDEKGNLRELPLIDALRYCKEIGAEMPTQNDYDNLFKRYFKITPEQEGKTFLLRGRSMYAGPYGVHAQIFSRADIFDSTGYLEGEYNLWTSTPSAESSHHFVVASSVLGSVRGAARMSREDEKNPTALPFRCVQRPKI